MSVARQIYVGLAQSEKKAPGQPNMKTFKDTKTINNLWINLKWSGLKFICTTHLVIHKNESWKGKFKNLIEESLYYEMTNVDLVLNHRTLTFEAMIHLLLVILYESYIYSRISYLIFTRRQGFFNALVWWRMH